MSEIAHIWARLGVNDDDYRAGLREARREQDRFVRDSEEAGQKAADGMFAAFKDPDQLKGWGQKMTLSVTAPLVALGTYAAKAASDVDESLNKVNVVFGANAEQISRWSQTAAKSLGMSRQEALEAAGSFGNLFRTIGLGQQDAARMSQAIIQLGTDLGSFNNINPGEVLEKLRSGLSGEAEPLRALGVFLTEDAVKAKAMAMGLAEAGEEASEAAKIQARYALILEQTGTAQGDFARTAEGAANKARTLQGAAKDTAAEFGEKLKPAMEKVLEFGIKTLDTFNALPDPLKNTTLALAGIAALAGPLFQVAGAIAAIRMAGGAGGVAAGVAGGVAAGAAAGPAGWQLANLGGVSDFVPVGKKAGALGRLGAGLATPVGGLLAVGGAAVLGAGVLAHYGSEMNEADLEADRSVAASEEARSRMRRGAEASELNQRLQRIRKLPQASTANGRARIAMLERRLEELRGWKPGAAPQSASGPKPFSSEDQEKLSESMFTVRQAQAEAQVAGAREGFEDRTALRVMLPVLQDEQADLKKRAETLKPKITTNAKAAIEYQKLTREIWQIEREMIELRTRAADEQRDEIEDARKKNEQERKKREQEQKRQEAEAKQLLHRNREVDERMFDVRQQAARTHAGGAAEGWEARGQAAELTPVLQQRIQQLDAEARQLAPRLQSQLEARERYSEIQREAWRLRHQIVELDNRAAKEEQDQAKRAATEAQKAANEQRQVADLRFETQKTKLEANPFLTDEQRKARMGDLLLGRFRMLHRAQAGESDLDRAKREQEAAGVGAEILKNAGGDRGFARVAGGGRLALFNQRRMAGIANDLDRIALEESRRPPVAAMNAPARVELSLSNTSLGQLLGSVFRDPSARQEFEQLVAGFLDRRGRMAAPGPVWQGG